MAVLEGGALASAAAEVRAYLRAGGGEDALIERLTAGAAALCETFTGRWLVARAGAEMLSGPGWRRLTAAPVRAITAVERDGVALAAGDYAIDIDADGRGWVRLGDGGRARVRFEAGLATDWAELPESLHHGVVRLAAHLYTHRAEVGEAGPPAAVTAMWRPWRRIGIGGPAHV